jgi:hypothetical protein
MRIDSRPPVAPPRLFAGIGFLICFMAAAVTGWQANAPAPSQGDSFSQPPWSVHRVSENMSNTKPAQLLAEFVPDDGARLTEAILAPAHSGTDPARAPSVGMSSVRPNPEESQ